MEDFFSRYLPMSSHRLANITQAITVVTYKCDITQDTAESVQINLELTWKLYPCFLDFIVFEDTMHATEEKSLLIIPTY